MERKTRRDRRSRPKIHRRASGKVELRRPHQAWTVEIAIEDPSGGRWNAVQAFPTAQSAEGAWEASRRTCRQHAAIAENLVVVP